MNCKKWFKMNQCWKEFNAQMLTHCSKNKKLARLNFPEHTHVEKMTFHLTVGESCMLMIILVMSKQIVLEHLCSWEIAYLNSPTSILCSSVFDWNSYKSGHMYLWKNKTHSIYISKSYFIQNSYHIHFKIVLYA